MRSCSGSFGGAERSVRSWYSAVSCAMRIVFGDMVDGELVGCTLEFLVDQICMVYALSVLVSLVMKL